MTREHKICWVVLGIGGLTGMISKPGSVLGYVGVVMMAGVAGYAIKGLIDEVYLDD